MLQSVQLLAKLVVWELRIAAGDLALRRILRVAVALIRDIDRERLVVSDSHRPTHTLDRIALRLVGRDAIAPGLLSAGLFDHGDPGRVLATGKGGVRPVAAEVLR